MLDHIPLHLHTTCERDGNIYRIVIPFLQRAEIEYILLTPFILYVYTTYEVCPTVIITLLDILFQCDLIL